MFLISMMCLSVFAGLQQITKVALAVALRNEGYHHLQQESERLLNTDYSSFIATTQDTTIKSAVKTSYSPSGAAQMAITSDNATGRVNFTRRVVEVASTTTTRTLRVEVTWTWQGRSNTITTQLFRMR